MALTKIDDRGLKTPIDLLDNEKIRFGTGNDLEVYHDGSNNFIVGTANNWIKSTGTQGFTAGSDYQLKCIADGAVELYYDGSKKLETTSYGVYSAGMGQFDDGIKLIDNQVARFGAGNDLQIYHDGTHSYLKNGAGSLRLSVAGGSDEVQINKGAVDENMAKFIADGAVELYHNNVKRFETTSDGVQIYGLDDGESGARGDFKFKQADGTSKIMFDGSAAQFEFLDNSKATFGTGDDLQIYHDGSNSYINHGGTGNLRLVGNSNIILQDNNGEALASFNPNGAVELYHNNSKVLWTDSNGFNSQAASGDYHFNFLSAGGNQWGMWNQDNNIRFMEDSTERMRITSTGYLHVGPTFAEPTSSSFGCRFGGGSYHAVSRDSSGSAVFRAYGNAGEFRTLGDGDCQNTGNSYGAISDQTLKQDIVDASSQWNDIKQIKVRKFRFKDNPTAPLQIGVVAQELETISPGLVKDNPDELYTASDALPEGKNIGDVKEKGYKAVKYSVLYMKAVKALQEAMAKIETLETEVAALKAK